MTDETSFASLVLGKVDPNRPFQPQVFYDPDGDCIEFLVSNDPFYGERIDSLVTVYYSEETNEIVGSLIKGVKKFIKEVTDKVPGFKIEVEDGRIRLVHLFTARLWYAEPSGQRQQLVLAYKKLRAVAEKVDAAAELCSA